MSYKATVFTYDPEILTNEQKKAIADAERRHKDALEKLQKDEDYRMQNYYDCVDDYSWGGPCSKANALAQDRVKHSLEETIEEIVRGGYLIKVREQNVLKDINTGDVVACGTHKGTYGRFFATNDGKFISCAKKVSTYEKKGYRPYIQTITEKVKRDGVWRNGDTRYKVIETVSITEDVSTEVVY